MGKKFGGKNGDCPITEDISDRLLRLPFYFQLSENDQNQVIELIQSFHV
jgi:dTDP-4-amino-4,6-dideoxygalactose transaminase